MKQKRIRKSEKKKKNRRGNKQSKEIAKGSESK